MQVCLTEVASHIKGIDLKRGRDTRFVTLGFGLIKMETTNGVDKVVTKKNGFHKGPMELYLVRISPACRAVWLYVIQVNITSSFFNYFERSLVLQVLQNPSNDKKYN